MTARTQLTQARRQSTDRCAACLRAAPDVTIAVAKVHGPVPLCERCRGFAQAKGWLRT